MTVDINKVYDLTKGRLNGVSLVEKAAKENDDILPIQYLKDKIGKNNGWNVCKSTFNQKDKSIDFTIMVNATDTKDIHFTYEQICREFWMKKFTVKGNESYIPTYMTLEERDEIEKPMKLEELRKDKKWLKKHPEFDPDMMPKDDKNPFHDKPIPADGGGGEELIDSADSYEEPNPLLEEK